MRKSARLLLGISLFWLALSVLFDGVNTLVLPNTVLKLVGEGRQATILGLLTFVGLFAGMLVQPVAGALSDQLRARWGRGAFIGIALAFLLVSLAVFGIFRGLVGAIVGYLAIQITASAAQAGQQGYLPDLVPEKQRGVASGWKGFMDIGGAMLGFVVLGQLLGGGRIGLALAAIGAILVVTFLLTVALVREDRQPALETPEMEAGSRQSNPLVHAFRLDLPQHRPFAWLVLARFLFLLGTFAVGRFLLYFVGERLGLDPNQAAAEAGMLLAALALVTVLAAPFAGWAADRLGRVPLMAGGAVFNALGTLLLITAVTPLQILLFGSLMSLGSAAFASANWAMTADLVPPDEAARFFGLANFGTAGAAAAAGLFGVLIDGANQLAPGSGFPALFVAASLASLASALVLRAVRSSLASSPVLLYTAENYPASSGSEGTSPTTMD